MKKTALAGMLFFYAALVTAQKPSLRLQAFQRYYISGMAPTPVMEVGGKEIMPQGNVKEPQYFIYLISDKLPSLQIKTVGIKHHLYQATIHKIDCKPVVITSTVQKDTLVRYTDDDVWQINITGKAKNNNTPKKDIAALLAENELVIKLQDKQGKYYIRTVRHITTLESERGQ